MAKFIPFGGQDVDIGEVVGVVVMFEYRDGTQTGWRVDQLTDLSWRGIASAVTLQVKGRFHRIAKNPQSREIERRMAVALGRGEYDPDDGSQPQLPSG